MNIVFFRNSDAFARRHQVLGEMDRKKPRKQQTIRDLFARKQRAQDDAPTPTTSALCDESSGGTFTNVVVNALRQHQPNLASINIEVELNYFQFDSFL